MEGKFPYSDNTRNARKFEYLGEFEAKIENTLDAYSGAQMGSFGQTSLKWKISCKCTFKVLELFIYYWETYLHSGAPNVFLLTNDFVCIVLAIFFHHTVALRPAGNVIHLSIGDPRPPEQSAKKVLDIL